MSNDLGREVIGYLEKVSRSVVSDLDPLLGFGIVLR